MREPIPTDLFCRRAGLDETDRRAFLGGSPQLVSPKMLGCIMAAVILSDDVLARIFRAVPLRADPDARPYERSRPRVLAVRPRELKFGQKFVQKDKLELGGETPDRLAGLFSGLAVRSARPPLALIGRDKSGSEAAALLMPPILERHGNDLVLLDGVHRAYSAHLRGERLVCVVLDRVSGPPPFATGSLRRIKPLAVKPEEEKDRYYGLKPELFRDLDAVGIDG